MMINVNFFLILFFLFLITSNTSSASLPDLIIPEKKEIIKKKPPYSSLQDLEWSLEDVTTLDEIEKKRLKILLLELQGKHDSAYLTLKGIKNQKGQFWYKMKELFLVDKLGLEEDKIKISKSLKERLFEPKLEISKIAFCSSVQSFGQYKEIPKNELGKIRKMILYIEIQNLKQEIQTKKNSAYYSSFNAHFDILDDSGRIMYKHRVNEFFDQSNSFKRDYYCWIKWVPSLARGKYTIVFHIEDTKIQSHCSFEKSFIWN